MQVEQVMSLVPCDVIGIKSQVQRTKHVRSYVVNIEVRSSMQRQDEAHTSRSLHTLHAHHNMHVNG